jgi:hypothetical protein
VTWALNGFPARALRDALRGKPAGMRDSLAAMARRMVGAAPATHETRAATTA